jgi:hypothetical protein
MNTTHIAIAVAAGLILGALVQKNTHILSSKADADKMAAAGVK